MITLLLEHRAVFFDGIFDNYVKQFQIFTNTITSYGYGLIFPIYFAYHFARNYTHHKVQLHYVRGTDYFLATQALGGPGGRVITRACGHLALLAARGIWRQIQ